MKTNKVGKNFDHKLDCGQILWPIGTHGMQVTRKGDSPYSAIRKAEFVKKIR